ncbi:hypothetical protein MMC20_001349 [Loxospora ochrophaea]|nr:hypothetical protein [Loxospora ochrophaea]
MGSFYAFAFTYTLGGLTLLPLLVILVLLHAHLTFPHRISSAENDPVLQDSVRDLEDDGHNIKSGSDALTEKFTRGHEPDVAAGYFAVTREYVPSGINGKPPERTTPAGEVIAEESPSVYQSMYRSLFERKQVSSLDLGQSNGKAVKRTRNLFFVVLRHRHLMLYDDSEQVDVRHVIYLDHHNVGIYGGGGQIPEGELWIKRNAICLSRKADTIDITPPSKPFYLFSENCSEKEDFYFALLHNQEKKSEGSDRPPRGQQFKVKDIITLVQRLHSSEEQLQTRWINALVGRLFLAMYKTQDIEDFIRQKITKKIARVKKPAFLSGIVLQKIDMGEAAPFITNPKLKDLTVDGDCCVEADVQYSGKFRLEVAATARIDLGSRFKVREVNLVLAVVIKKLEGHALVRLKPPPSNRLWISFEKMPNMEMSIEPIVSSRQITYGIILRAIESRIREVLAETIVLPHWDDSPFTNTLNQRFRGGIWAREAPRSSTETTNVPEEPIEDEAESYSDSNVVLPASIKSRDDRTMSMPVSASSSSPSLKSRRAARSTHTVAENVDTGSSSSLQKKPEAPRAVRSNSFASAADPIVSLETANIESRKPEMNSKQAKDAASAMMAISSRSPPTSPGMTPLASPDAKPRLIPESQGGGLSISPPKDDVLGSHIELPNGGDITNSPSLPGTPTSFDSASIKSALGNQSSYPSSTQSTAHSLTPAEKRQALASLGAATTAAKNWGWNVLNRSRESKSGPENITSQQRMGTPERPIGRGQPLPPPGQPLPSPSGKASPISMPRRKNLPPPALPQRKPLESKTRPVPAPPLPVRRQASISTASEVKDDGLLVVEAPPDSEPSSPRDESHVETSGQGDLDDNDRRSDSIGKDDNLNKENDPAIAEGLPRPRRGSSPTRVEDETSLPSWSAAQEEAARSRSIWVDGDEHS